MKPIVIVCFLGLVTALLLVTSCETCTYDISFSLDPGGKLHIFSDEASVKASGIPSTALTYTTATRTDAFAQTDVPLRACTSLITALEGKIKYEYHAGSRNSAASIEFVIKDSAQQKVLWKGRQPFRPARSKAEIDETFTLPINLTIDATTMPTVIVEAIPRSAGDFGFFIYELSGVLKVQ